MGHRTRSRDGSRESTVDGAGRQSLLGVAVVAGVVAVVSLVIAVADIVGGGLWVFEVLAAFGLFTGLAIAFGFLDRRPRRRLARATGTSADIPVGLASEVQERLARLDPVEHRRLEVGSPWPTVVVGPTGVDVVTVAAVADADAAGVGRLAAIVSAVRDLLGGLDVEVTGSLVVARPHGRVTGVGDVRVVDVDQLGEVLSSGRLVTMPVVAEVFRRLSGSLHAGASVTRAS